VAGASRSPDPVHRSGKPLGERLQRELQRQVQGRADPPGDLLFAQRSPGLGGAVAQGVQYDPAAQLAGLPTARSAGDPARSSVDQAARIAGARSGPEGCGQTNLTCGTTLGGRSRVARGIRVVLGALFVMTGAMKFVVPMLAAAWAGQLAAANIPFPELNRWVVPFIEMAAGVALLTGFYTRISTLLVLSIMAVATYVHLVVDDPALFPLQPAEPIIPAVVMILSVYLLVKGGASRSLDLRATRATG